MSQPTEIHTLAGAYALDALTEIERAGFARHVIGCSSCAIEVAELRETASRLGASALEAPPSRLRDAVLAEVAATRQVTAGKVERPVPGDAVARWRRWTAASVAAGVVALGGIAAVWTVEQGRVDDLRQQAQALEDNQVRLNSVLAAGDVRLRSATVDGGGKITVAVSPSLNDGVVLMSGLPALPAGKTYQMWLISGTLPTSVGLMPPGARSGSAVLNAVGSADTFGVTVEPESGSPAPTTTPITVRLA